MKNKEQIEKIIHDHFGLNAGYVSEQYEEYIKDKNNVGDYWKSFFDDLLNNGKISENTNSKSPVTQKSEAKEQKVDDNFEVIAGVGAKIIANMEASLTIPTATSLRTISVKLLEENRRIINYHLKRLGQSKISYSHIVAFAIVEALKNYPSLNNSYEFVNGKPYINKKEFVNLGIAVDMVKKNGERTLIVPNIKKACQMNFAEFKEAYDKIVEKARTGKIEPSDFENTTISLTNPGGIGTVSSTPRLMTGQGCIIAIGAIDYPSEFKAMQQGALASLGIGKVMNITNTYDHRIIQGAESGYFLNEIDALLKGERNFYTELFEDLEIPQMPVNWDIDNANSNFFNGSDHDFIVKQAKVPLLVNIYRVRGHLIANLNPLSIRTDYYSELDPAEYGFTIWDYDRVFSSNIKGFEKASLRKILDVLRQTYCEMVGAEFMHIQHPEEKQWLMEKMEGVFNKPKINDELKKRILEKLIIAEGFEHFLHTRYLGHKRFSLEGSETVIPVLDHLLTLAADDNAEEVFLGMAHRGRLNVLANIIGKKYKMIFSEFEDDIADRPQGTGDVKYHLGANGVYETYNNKNINVSVASNPSHLEFVDPVVEGIVRAKQSRNNDNTRDKIIPVLIHGDAAFAGQGVVAETLNFSQLKGYRTGGTVHIIINNQIGFTTTPEDARSSSYATDVAKMVQSPIFHVNGDDPEAALWVTQLAFEYRQKFNKDVVIDLFGYRRHGHNEGDDPVYTQPMMYKKIKTHPSVKMIYADKLISEKIITEDAVKKMDDNIFGKLEESISKAKEVKEVFKPDRPLAYPISKLNKIRKKTNTAISKSTISKIVDAITTMPNGFDSNPKIEKTIKKRKEIVENGGKFDWAFGETLAFGSLLLEGFPVRLSGQDSARGTFSQRHLILTDMTTGEEIIPLNSIDPKQAIIEPLDSLLSENGVLGFEYGYSLADPLTLVMWEAQFGDFANGAQVIIDNFIAASKTKWNQPCNLVLLLPHAQEGQGPEHSSARLERFLILCAQDNMIVANPTTPAQYFHVLRKQILGRIDVPLILMTPKSLLRLPQASSEIDDFTKGKFQEIIDDKNVVKSKVTKIILTSGKVYYDLLKYKTENNIVNTALIRVEQYYPFEDEKVLNILKSYKKVQKITWVQEEPQNMGAWNFIFIRLFDKLPKKLKLNYVGRKESPSPASGSSKEFNSVQSDLVKRAFE
ncbi:MAG: multifunctional oxoglutarate decarboxylase/oxoglutarate dehydrogenase thiamine pyrophosphate-binding subunit/dihydrolipoyllysine-residue succinyltransferase subunit [Ignavibacteriales bacterium]|nr:multifunctional oxoglutarate decarboxylase/oxoglutarate dehydrogenase thiamine pyrophosphate-binding subunit/dihydrolipoyllysine-residue succinyltransferase subunit [Ignavibacteriales bacterium]